MYGLYVNIVLFYEGKEFVRVLDLVFLFKNIEKYYI